MCTHSEYTELLVDARVSFVLATLVSRVETCDVTTVSLVKAGGYAGFNSGTAESMAVSYCAPCLLADKSAPDALY